MTAAPGTSRVRRRALWGALIGVAAGFGMAAAIGVHSPVLGWYAVHGAVGMVVGLLLTTVGPMREP